MYFILISDDNSTDLTPGIFENFWGGVLNDNSCSKLEKKLFKNIYGKFPDTIAKQIKVKHTTKHEIKVLFLENKILFLLKIEIDQNSIIELVNITYH